MSQSEMLTDHDEIRRWVEAREGRPARVKGTGSDVEGGLLRIDFREPDAALEEMSWEAFFESFEDSDLSLIVGTAPESRFNKFVRRG